MTDTMIYEQEQLLMAIDDIDDAQIMAEAAVISKMADLYIRQMMIQESYDPSDLDKIDSVITESSLFQESKASREFKERYATPEQQAKAAEKADKKAARKEKFNNSKPVTFLKKIFRAIGNVFKVIGSAFAKFFAHFKPSYIKNLINVKRSDFAAIAKKYGCKVKVGTDGSYTLLVPFIDLSAYITWCGKMQKSIDKLAKGIAAGKPVKVSKTEFDIGDKMMNAKKYAKYTEAGETSPEALAKHGKKQWFPTKMMSVEEFEDVSERGYYKTNAVTGKSKFIQSAQQAVKGVIDNINTIIASLDQLPSEGEAAQQFAPMIESANAILNSAQTAQAALNMQIKESWDIVEAIGSVLVAGDEEHERAVAKSTGKFSKQLNEKKYNKRADRNDAIRNQLQFGSNRNRGTANAAAYDADEFDDDDLFFASEE